MTTWTVLLKTDEGTQLVTLEAEVATRTDDGKELEFYNFDSLKEAFESFAALASDTSKEESIANFGRLLRTFCRFRVASFKSDALIGYYRVDMASSDTGG